LGIFGKVLLALGLIFGIGAGLVGMQSVMQHRAPTDVIGTDVRMPFIAEPQDLFHKDRVAILLLGIDYDYNSKDEEMSANARTDTIKAVALNLPSAQNPAGSIAILSVPRDMDAIMPDGSENKVNAGYGGFNGNSAMAAHNSEKVVGHFLGVPGFDRYVTLRINATKSLVDAIGGIDVVPDETMNYDDNWGHLHIHFIGGKKYHMDGEDAVSYSRFRHDECSDPCRIKRQDQVIRLTIAKLKNDKFNDLMHITQLIDVVRKNVYTDLSQQEMLSLAWAYQHVDLSKIDTEQVPYTGDKQLACCGDVIVADDVKKRALVERIFLQPVMPVVPPDARAVAAVNPGTIHVEIENGSGVAGEGAALADSLRKQGFVVDSVANAARFGYDATEIHVHSVLTPLAGERVRTALALATATVQPDARPSAADVTVIVGRDYAATDSERQASTSK
jgi:LCP family protein required for cell wall assembly